MTPAYYNEFDPYAAQWLRNLIAAGHIAPGDVDERSILHVQPEDLSGYTQCHFFAGIGVWSYALRLAGWPDSRPVWTGSCPCQPFSAAGKGNGFSDERHLWPAWFHLISQSQPDVIFGEQVASKDGLEWLDLVQADLEAAGYANGALDLCAAGVGAPHIRQRLFFVGYAIGEGLERFGGRHKAEGGRLGAVRPVAEAGEFSGVADAEREQRIWRRSGEAGDESRPEQRIKRLCDAPEGEPPTGPTNSHWRSADWLACRDGKWRPVEPGTFPLAHGAPARVGRLRAYGNAIVPQVAVEVIRAFMEYRP